MSLRGGDRRFFLWVIKSFVITRIKRVAFKFFGFVGIGLDEVVFRYLSFRFFFYNRCVVGTGLVRIVYVFFVCFVSRLVIYVIFIIVLRGEFVFFDSGYFIDENVV